MLQRLGWSAGDMVMLRLSDDDPEVLSVVPEAVSLRRFRRGEEAERLMRLTGNTPATEEARPGVQADE